MKLRFLAAVLAVAMIAASFSGCYTKVKKTSSSSEESGPSLTSDLSSGDSSLESGDITSGDSSITSDGTGTGTSGGGTVTSKSGGGTPSDPPSSSPGNKYTSFTGFKTYGDKLSDLLKNNFRYDDVRMQDSPNPPKAKDPITLWGYAGYMEQCGARVEADPGNAVAVAEYKKALGNLAPYIDKGRTDSSQIAYHCWADPNGDSEIFYDDNVWVLLEFIRAYKVLNDSQYLELAKRNWTYITTGWDDQLGGGIYWKDSRSWANDKPQKNTCINAPMAYASAKLFDITKEAKYKEWAIKTYNWTVDKLLDKTDNIFWDKIILPNSYDRRKYTYNTGNMISAAATLYKITNDAKYLNDANTFADAASKKWLGTETVSGNKAVFWVDSGSSWFNANLVLGFIELSSVNAAAKTYVTDCKTSLAFACLSAPSSPGYINDNWKSSSPVANPTLLGQSATARTLYMLAAAK